MGPSPEVAARDAGFDLLSKINRWLIAGAVGLAGFLSLIASQAFHGHAASSRSAVVAAGGGASATANGAGEIGPSAQLPSAVSAPTAPAVPAVVSGGS